MARRPPGHIQYFFSAGGALEIRLIAGDWLKPPAICQAQFHAVVKLNCTEQVPFREDFAEIEQNLPAAGMPNFFIEETIKSMNLNSEGCEVWGDGLPAPTPERYGAYPTLIINGQFDSLTPPAFAERAFDAIPQAQYVSIPNAWHSILGNNGSCPTEITLQFLADPGLTVGTTCTEKMKIEFLLPEKQEGEQNVWTRRQTPDTKLMSSPRQSNRVSSLEAIGVIPLIIF